MVRNCRIKRIILAGALLAAALPAAQAQTAPHRWASEERGLGRMPGELGRIVGGVEAKPRDWPWQVGLKRKSADGSFKFICGGSVVKGRWVLTAGHCVTDGEGKALAPESFQIIEGTNDIKSDSSDKLLHVKRVIPYEKFDARTLQNDIALLELSEQARSAPVPYADGRNAALENPGQVATVTGWGLVKPIHYEAGANGQVVAMDAVTRQALSEDEIQKNYLATGLMQLEMPLVARDACEAKYKPKGYGITIDDRVLCAGRPTEEKKDACHGDSGGPLVVKDETGYVQVGVVSLGDPDCVPEGLPGIYTRVAAFEPWLRQTIGVDQDAPPPPDETQAVAESAVAAENPNPGGLAVSFAQGATVRVGQEVQFRATAEEAGYLVLFDVRSDGTVVQIYPNPFSLRSLTGKREASNRLDASRPLLTPDPSNPYSGFTFTIDPPVGGGKILGVLSKTPIQELQVVAGDGGAGRTLGRTLRTFGSRREVLELFGLLSRKVQRDMAETASKGVETNYSIAITDYRIVK